MATIIDALLVTLGLDNAEFKKGAEETNKDQEKLRHEAEKTAKEMQKQGQEAGEFFLGLAEKASFLFAVLVGGHELKELGHQMLEAEDAGLKLSKMMNVNIEDLQAWQRAVALEGGTTESFNSSLKGLNAQLVSIENHLPRAERSLKIFASLGIHEAALKGKDAIGVMGLLAEKFEGMSGGKALALGERLGLDENTIRLLLKGKEAIGGMLDEQKELGVYTMEEAEAAEKFNDTLKNAETAWQSASRAILTAAAPALQYIAELLVSVGKWAKDNPDTVRVIFVGIATAISVATVAMIAFTAASMVNPVVLILTAIVVLIGLIASGITWVYNEWKKWTEGGSSALAEFFQVVTDIWNRIKNVVMTVIATIKELVMDYVDIIINQFKLFWAILTGDAEGAKAAFKKLCEAIGKFFSLLFKYMVYEFAVAFFMIQAQWNHAWDNMKAKAKQVLEDVKAWLKDLGPGGALGFATNPGGALAYRGVQKFIQERQAAKQQQISNSKEISIGTIQVQTQATDAKGIATDIGGAIQEHGLVNQIDTGFN